MSWLAAQLQQKQQELQQQQQLPQQPQPPQQIMPMQPPQDPSQMASPGVQPFSQGALRVQQASGMTEDWGGAFVQQHRASCPAEQYPVSPPMSGNLHNGMDGGMGSGGRGRKRQAAVLSGGDGMDSDDMLGEPSAERRQKRMIKNRESAARSRARKQVRPLR